MNKRVSFFLTIFAIILIVNVLGPAIRWGMEIVIETVLLAAVLPLLWGRGKQVEKKPDTATTAPRTALQDLMRRIVQG